MGVVILKGGQWKSHQMVMFEQRLEGGQGFSHKPAGGRAFQAEGTAKCKGPKVSASLKCPREK